MTFRPPALKSNRHVSDSYQKPSSVLQGGGGDTASAYLYQGHTQCEIITAYLSDVLFLQPLAGTLRRKISVKPTPTIKCPTPLGIAMIKQACTKTVPPLALFLKPVFLLIFTCLLSGQAKAQLFQNHTPQLTAQAVSNTAIQLTWMDDTVGITGFYVEVPSTVAGGWIAIQVLGSTARSFLVQNLAPGTAYTFGLRAYQGNGATKVYSLRATATAISENGPPPGPTGGFGTQTRGGQDGTAIYRVTNLGNGFGSLAFGLQTLTGPRVIVFEVSGQINLTTPIRITSPFVTIAGETAPSPGITITGAPISIQTHDVVLRNLRFRIGDGPGSPPDDRDGIQVLGSSTNPLSPPVTYNVVVDHCSVSWSIDELASTYWYGVQDVTFSNNIFSEALNIATAPNTHPKGAHPMGLLIGHMTKNATVIGNIFAHNGYRNPVLGAGTTAVVANNLIYDCYNKNAFMTYGVSVPTTVGYGEPVDASVLSNVLKRGPVNGTAAMPFYLVDTQGGVECTEPDSRIYLSDNLIPPTNSVLVTNNAPYAPVTPVVGAAPITCPGLTLIPAADVEHSVLLNAGARPSDSDAVDLRIMNDIIAGTGGIINSQSSVGGWPVLAQNIRILTPPADLQGDADGDGKKNVDEWLEKYRLEVEEGYPLPAPTTVIVDNASASGVTLTGSWTVSTSPTGYYGTNFLSDDNTGKGTKSVRFTPTIPTTGAYAVFMRWPRYYLQATNAPVDIVSNTGTQTVTVDQANVSNGARWMPLGVYSFNAGSAGSVLLRTTGTTALVSADSVAFVLIPPQIIVDNTDATATTKTGSWSTSTAVIGFQGVNYASDGNAGQGTKSFRITPNLPVGGNYQVWARWPASATHASNTPVTITSKTGTTPLTVNQQATGGTWVSLGTYNFDAGPVGSVVFGNTGTNGTVVVDAVRFDIAP
jgi:hypothetical protein